MADNPHPEPSPRNTLIVFGILIVVIVVAAALLITTRPQPVKITLNPPQPTPTALPTSTPSPITVYVTGAVAQSGQLFTLPPGSRVQDALAAAGGTTDAADLERVNLADILHDGDQVDVPEKGTQTVLATPSAGEVIHINTASVEEIDTLPGIGPALAQRIIDYREANGSFTSLDELDAVEGVGPSLLEDLRGLVAFD